jgi:CBS domain-containing protein
MSKPVDTIAAPAAQSSSQKSLIAALVEQMRRHAPFDRMERDHLALMAERFRLGYYAKGEVLIGPGQAPPDRLFVIKQGVVLGEQDVARVEHDSAFWELGPWDSFPLGALLAKRPVASVYRAKEDTFCYELPVEEFRKLLHLSEPFHDFCTRRLASLLEQSKHIIQAQYARTTTEQQSMNSPLSAVIRRSPVSCTADTSVEAVLRTMKGRNIGSMIVADAGDVPTGIFTLHDVLDRVALARLDLSTTIGEVMTQGLITLPPRSYAYEAALAMIRHGIRHVLVTDEETGRLEGVISERDLFSLQKVGLRQISAAIRRAEDVGSLCQSAHDIRQFAINMLAQGVGSEQLTEIISTFNDLLTARVIELTVADMGLDQTPLVGRFCWLALGSEGRYEQTLSTDQDNGIIFELPDGWTADQAREQLLPFARRINESLDKCGFPLCKGGVMASNPPWCLSLEEWRGTFANWIQRGDGPTLLNASIFFDFRPLWGEASLCAALRDWLNGYVVQYRMFLRLMVINALDNRPPLGVVRDFVTRGEGNTLDLKLNGTTPFVDAARVMALYAGSGETGTIPRLRAIGKHWNLEEPEVEGWVESFLYIQMLRLRAQYEKLQRGETMDNNVDPDSLNDLDRRILKESFRQARKLQALMEKSFQF